MRKETDNAILNTTINHILLVRERARVGRAIAPIKKMQQLSILDEREIFAVVAMAAKGKESNQVIILQ